MCRAQKYFIVSVDLYNLTFPEFKPAWFRTVPIYGSLLSITTREPAICYYFDSVLIIINDYILADKYVGFRT